VVRDAMSKVHGASNIIPIQYSMAESNEFLADKFGSNMTVDSRFSGAANPIDLQFRQRFFGLGLRVLLLSFCYMLLQKENARRLVR